MPDYFARTFDFGRDVDGAYTAQPYFPAREASEIARWQAQTGLSWGEDLHGTLLDELPHGTRSTNHGPGPAWGDLVAAGYFEEDDHESC